jgi:hypothetical protein
VTPIQRASAIAVGSYKAAARLLNAEERAVLRSILASAIAKDSADAIRYLDDEQERKVA